MASKTERFSILPGWPLMLTDRQAADYVQLSVADLHRCVAHGELPPPRRLAGHLRWSRREIDQHLHQSLTAPCDASDPIAAAIDTMRIA